MTEEERQSEIREILERFGAGVGDILKRALEARERNEKSGVTLDPVPIETSEPSTPVRSGTPAPLPPSLSTSSTRPNSPTRGSRKLRFAELVPENVHVYESAPPSPRKKSFLALPLPPPPDSDDALDVVSLGAFNNTISNQTTPESVLSSNRSVNISASGSGSAEPISSASDNVDDTEPDEGTPEYIRKRYFPSAPVDNPDIAWMTLPPSSSVGQSIAKGVRFDLTGTPIPQSKLRSLPTHLGLHHHAEGQSAGYTLDDIFLLSRSKVPAQRATMLGVLRGLVNWWRRNSSRDLSRNIEVRFIIEELQSATPPLAKRIMFAGLEALPERGVIGVRAVEIVWESIVGWDPIPDGMDDEEYYEWGGVELGASDLVDSLPFEVVLPQLCDVFISPNDGAASDEHRMTPVQRLIISILHKLAFHSNKFADQITALPKLVSAIIRNSIAYYTSPYRASPDTSALRLLTILALSSRTNAQSICESADLFLRIVAALGPREDNRQAPETLEMLTGVLRLYAVLARYGLYSHIATDGRDLWWRVSSYIETTVSQRVPSTIDLKLVSVWADLLQTWIICATDPHRTTPPHDLLWSQVVGWEWGKELLKLSETLSQSVPESTHFWRARAAVFRALAVWLEGSKVNSIKGGEEERLSVIVTLGKTFKADGLDGKRVTAVVEEMKSFYREEVSPLNLRCLGKGAYELLSVVRVWLACCSPSTQEPLVSLPFDLPFAQISELCASMVVHSDASQPRSYDKQTTFLRASKRPLTSLLSYYLRLSRSLPGTSEDLWLAQAFSIMLTLQPGDEECGLDIINQILGLITPQWTSSRGLNIPQIIWETGGLEVLRPVLRFEVNPNKESYIGLLCITPSSLSLATTQRLPSITTSSETAWSPSGLPFRRDWTVSPLDHVLHSGSSFSIFSSNGVLSSTFNASETEIVRATLLLTNLAKEVILRFANALSNAVLTREEAVFTCMKVFMLEHEQDQNQVSQEVFRDGTVARYMEELLGTDANSKHAINFHSQTTLEEVAAGFLSSSSTFYQYYTDFVALYDSISFSHPLFARLLLPPTSMRYPIDYRKHLWNDFSHVIRTIRTPIDQVISADLKEYFWPVEEDPQMIGAYLRVLVKYGLSLEGFVRVLAIHHVACNIWHDLLHGRDPNEGRSSGLLKVIIGQCSPEIVREVMRYRQEKDGNLRVPPTCFNTLDGCQDQRLAWIERWAGPHLLQDARGLFDSAA
ncbi:hypothetical protein L218DRAFT_941506 [Marasmius fiardii PR-910]|nr:hypothetical protein L218DRAFT_941506 [Marasmius fiardii PR-910]